MGIEPFLISTAVLGVQAQRLVRRICPDCREEYTPNYDIPKEILASLGFEDTSELKFYRGKGCKKCRDSGYRGRMSIIEVLPVTDNIRECILKSSSAMEINRVALDEGMRPLMQDGWIKVLKGITTLEEVMRVTNIGNE